MSAASWFTRWEFSGVGLAVVALLTAAYVVMWQRARRAAPERTPVWWLVAYLLLGMGVLAYTLLGPVAAMSREYLWVFGLQLGLLTAVAPTGIALGHPLAVLVDAAPETRRDAVTRAARGRVVRAVAYPFVSSVIAMASLILVFFTGYAQASFDSPLVHAVLVVHLLVVGLLVVMPLLADDMLPAWATPGVCVLLACVDGLFDAIPGILVMTHHDLLVPGFPGFSLPDAVRSGLSPSLDQKFTGGALLAVAETIGLPLIAAVFVEWMRADRASARREDARLDAELGAGPSSSTPWWLENERR